MKGGNASKNLLSKLWSWAKNPFCKKSIPTIGRGLGGIGTAPLVVSNNRILVVNWAALVRKPRGIQVHERKTNRGRNGKRSKHS